MHQKLMTTVREKTAAFSCRDWPPFSRLGASQHLSVWIRIVIENQECEKEVNFRKKSGKVEKTWKRKYQTEKKVTVGKKKEKKNLIFTLCQRQSLERHHSSRNIILWLKHRWNGNHWSTPAKSVRYSTRTVERVYLHSSNVVLHSSQSGKLLGLILKQFI